MSDLKLSVAEILGRPGRYRDFDISASLESLGTPLAALADAPVDGSMRAESVVEGVLITGRVDGLTELVCARCLTDFQSPLDFEVCELFVGPGYEGPKDEDFYPIQGPPPEIDLEPMLRDAVTLALPLKPLCSSECRGLCAHCGKDLNEGPCDCKEDDVDPRWAELSALRDKLVP